jgi:hypothetical protein
MAGPALHAAVQRIASERGVAASELALVTGGGRMVVGGVATLRSTRLGTAVVLRLAWRTRGGGGGASKIALLGGPECHRPVVRRVEVGKEQLEKWKTYGGPELEAALASGAIALLSGRWLCALVDINGVLQPRQALPDEAFLSLSQVQQAAPQLGGLSIVCISHCWL